MGSLACSITNVDLVNPQSLQCQAFTRTDHYWLQEPTWTRTQNSGM